MTVTSRPTPPKAFAPPTLVLCRQCVQYVYEGTETCPQCGRNAREMGAHYRNGGHQVTEAIQQIERALERRKAQDATRSD
jgi:predicted amidophosphoribosyltransferase